MCEWLGLDFEGDQLEMAEAFEDFLPTGGRWIHVCRRELPNEILDYNPDAPVSPGVFNSHVELKEAFHGTSIHNIQKIVREGLKPGPSTTGHKEGIYCEGVDRKASVLCYIPRVQIKTGSPMIWGACISTMVDRQFGCTVNSQWCQQKGSVFVSGFYLHVINIRDLYTLCPGWIKVAKESLYAMGASSSDIFDEEQHASESVDWAGAARMSSGAAQPSQEREGVEPGQFSTSNSLLGTLLEQQR